MLRLIIATYLWAVVMALGVWDYYILRFPPCNLPRVYQEVLMPVVKVRAGNRTGSGVIISDTYILTAAHVVGKQREAGVYIYEYEYELSVVTIKTATVIITDTYKDLALLKLTFPNKSGLRRAKLAPRDYVPYLFTEVYAVGCSLRLNPRPSEGIITSIGINRWEISAPVLPGNSGGGVFLKDTHELIGITIWIRDYHGQLITTMTGIVPLNQIYEFLDKTPWWSHGGIPPGMVPHSTRGGTTPGVNSEEDKRQGLTGWSGWDSECAIGIRGPGGSTLLTKGGEKSWHKR